MGMKHAKEPERLHELAAAYALDALDEDDRRVFDEHLESCESCRDEVAAFGEAATALAYAAAAPEAPPALRGRILDAARAERGKVLPFRRRRRPAQVAAVAAAACLALGLGLWATLGTGGSPGTQKIALQGAMGTLTVADSGHAFLTVSNLASAPAGKTYEIWVIRSQKPLPAGLFSEGGRKVVVTVERKVRPGATVAVTLEPGGGVPEPTGQILFHALVPV